MRISNGSFLIPKSLLFFCTLFFISIHSIAQTDFADGITTTFISDADFNRGPNDTMYIDTGKNDVHFKRVVCYVYSSYDSLFHSKKLYQKSIVNFNRKGEATCYINFDSTGNLTDSIVIRYNKNYMEVRKTDYDKDNPLKKLQITKDEFFTYNDIGILINDSTFEKSYDDDDKTDLKGTISISVEKTLFDDKENTIETFKINDDDTSIDIRKYDHKSREIWAKSYYAGNWSYNYKKYDDSSNVIEMIDMNPNDTTRDECAFDRKNRPTLTMHYRQNTVGYKETTEYGEGNAKTVTKESYGDNSANSCQDAITLIKTYDLYGNEVSEVEINTSGGRTLTTTETHRYEYSPERYILSDSDFTMEKSKWHYSGTLKVYAKKFDSRRNMTEESFEGGDGTGDYRKTTYTYNAKNMTLETDKFNSCSDKAYQKETNIYYPDEVTRYKRILWNDESASIIGSTTTTTFRKDSRGIEEFIHWNNQYYHTVVDYED